MKFVMLALLFLSSCATTHKEYSMNMPSTFCAEKNDIISYTMTFKVLIQANGKAEKSFSYTCLNQESGDETHYTSTLVEHNEDPKYLYLEDHRKEAVDFARGLDYIARNNKITETSNQMLATYLFLKEKYGCAETKSLSSSIRVCLFLGFSTRTDKDGRSPAQYWSTNIFGERTDYVEYLKFVKEKEK